MSEFVSSPQAEAECGRLRRAPSAGPQALRAVAEEGLGEAGEHQAAQEAGLAAAPATVLLAAAPGCARPLNPRSHKALQASQHPVCSSWSHC